MNLLQKHFDKEPNEEIIREFPKNSGLRYIPIREVKKLLNTHFYKWGVSNLKVQYIQRGHDFFVSGSVELNLDFRSYNTNNMTGKFELLDQESYTFIGANTFNVKNEQAEGNNDNYEAILLANCIKNGAKNIGKFFGQNLNQLDDYLPKEEEPEPPKANPINKAIKKITKTKI